MYVLLTVATSFGHTLRPKLVATMNNKYCLMIWKWKLLNTVQVLILLHIHFSIIPLLTRRPRQYANIFLWDVGVKFIDNCQPFLKNRMCRRPKFPSFLPVNMWRRGQIAKPVNCLAIFVQTSVRSFLVCPDSKVTQLPHRIITITFTGTARRLGLRTSNAGVPFPTVAVILYRTKRLERLWAFTASYGYSGCFPGGKASV